LFEICTFPAHVGSGQDEETEKNGVVKEVLEPVGERNVIKDLTRPSAGFMTAANLFKLSSDN